MACAKEFDQILLNRKAVQTEAENAEDPDHLIPSKKARHKPPKGKGKNIQGKGNGDSVNKERGKGVSTVRSHSLQSCSAMAHEVLTWRQHQTTNLQHQVQYLFFLKATHLW